jgi:hypothetical protein
MQKDGKIFEVMEEVYFVMNIHASGTGGEGGGDAKSVNGLNTRYYMFVKKTQGSNHIAKCIRNLPGR